VIDTHSKFLDVNNLAMRFGDGEDAITAIDDVSFSVSEGEVVSVIGPSGCGKSTLLNAIGGLIAGFDGAVSLSGENISGPHPSIGMVFQEESAFPWRNVLENVAFPLELSGMAKAERLSRARHFSSATRRSFPAACVSALRLPVRSPMSRKFF
jgi:NitT/TauT family transport system ATP-binding protein